MTKQQQITSALTNFYQKPVAKVSLELFFSIAAVLFFAIFAIRPTLITMSNLIKELEDKRELNQQLSQKIAALSSAQAVYLGIQDRAQVLDEAIPSTPQFLNSLKLLEKVASDNQLVIQSATVNEIPVEKIGEAEVNPGTLKRASIPVSILVSGDYPTIRTFISDVINLRRTFIIDTIIFSRSEEREKTSLKATITLEIPYFES